MVSLRSAELRDSTPAVVASLRFDVSRIRKAIADQCVRIAVSNPRLSPVERELGLEVASIAATPSPLYLRGSLFSRLGQAIGRYENGSADAAAALCSLRLFAETLRAIDDGSPDAWRRAIVQAADAWNALGASAESSLDEEFDNFADRLNDAVIDLR